MITVNYCCTALLNRSLSNVTCRNVLQLFFLVNPSLFLHDFPQSNVAFSVFITLFHATALFNPISIIHAMDEHLLFRINEILAYTTRALPFYATMRVIIQRDERWVYRD